MDAQFRRILETYGPPLRRLCAAYCPREDDRQDLYQEIAFALWRALPAFRGDASERTWLYRVAHNVALTGRTRARRRESTETPLESAPDPASSFDERRADLLRAIQGLDPIDRELALLYLEGLTNREIADVLGIAEGAAAVRLTRLRAKLTARLNPTEAKP